jgi:hypothetical protein
MKCAAFAAMMNGQISEYELDTRVCPNCSTNDNIQQTTNPKEQ